MIKQLAVAATIIASAFIPSAAQAYSTGSECGNILGYQSCVNYQDPANPDVIMIEGPAGTERIEISCFADGAWEWESLGPNTKSVNNMIADKYCD